MTHDLGGPAFLWVIIVGAASGIFSLAAFRRWSNLAQLRLSANLVVAHLLEIQLFSDEPGVVIRAQRDLMAANGRILLQLLRPTLILLVPFALIFGVAESYFGRAALRPGESALVTIQFNSPPPKVAMRSPGGIDLDSPPVVIPIDRQVVWRVRAVHPASGNLEFSMGEYRLHKHITAAGGLAWIPASRSAATLTGELPLWSHSIQSIDIGYRYANIFGVNWLVWFSLSSLVAAGVLAFTL